MNNDLAFFHRATMAICGSLDVDKAVRDCAAFLRRHIPLDGIMLNTYEQERGAIRVLSMAPKLCNGRWDKPIYLSGETREWLEALGDGIFLYQESEMNPVAKQVNRALGIRTTSEIVLHLKLDSKKLGVVSVFSEAGGVFTDEHTRLMAMLHDPFATAMANAMRHREILQLKDLLADDNSYLKQELRSITGDEIVGARYGLRDVMEMVRQVAPMNSHVMLTGETGVGKELVANALHSTSLRRDRPLIKVNCGAFVDNLLDSELFGHEKGAFTGAVRSKRGRFERAHGGTLFLDEVGELQPGAQVRLLRVIQDGMIERVGGTEPLEVDVRIVCATHRNLAEMVANGSFREDLFFRLNVFPIHIPPLRQRKSDIPALVHHFIDRKFKAFNLSKHPVLAPGAMERLVEYQWPGNVRELENTVERALIRHKHYGEDNPMHFGELGAKSLTAPPVPNDGGPSHRQLTLNEVVSNYIQSILQATKGKIQGQDGAAAILGINPNTLRSRMKKLGVPFGRGVS